MRRKIQRYIEVWRTRGYPEGIPDEADPVLENLGKVPSFRAICRAIMKNDVALLSLGYTREPCDAYMYLKRIEIDAREKCAGCGNEPRVRNLKLGPKCWSDSLDDHVKKAKAAASKSTQLALPIR